MACTTAVKPAPLPAFRDDGTFDPDALIKITAANECHNGLQFVDGTVVDPLPWSTKHCAAGGIYFCRAAHARRWVGMYGVGSWVRTVRVPPHARLQHEPYDKYKASTVILGPRVPMREWLLALPRPLLWEWLRHDADVALPLEGVLDHTLWHALAREVPAALRHMPLSLLTPELCASVSLTGARTLLKRLYAYDGAVSAELERALVCAHAEVLGDVPRIRCTPELCAAAVAAHPCALEYVLTDMRTRELCEAATTVREDVPVASLYHVPSPWCSTEAMCLRVVRVRGADLQYVPRWLRTQEMCDAAVASDPHAIEAVPDACLTPEMIYACDAAHARIWRNITEELALTCVHARPSCISVLPGSARTPAVCAMALARDPCLFPLVYAPKVPDGCYAAAVRADPLLLRHVPDEHKTADMCAAAVAAHPHAVDAVPPRLRTPSMWEAALHDDVIASDFESMPRELWTPRLCELAVGTALRFLGIVPPELLTPAICAQAVARSGLALSFLPSEHHTPELHDAAVRTRHGMLACVPQPARTLPLCVIACTRMLATDTWGGVVRGALPPALAAEAYRLARAQLEVFTHIGLPCARGMLRRRVVA